MQQLRGIGVMSGSSMDGIDAALMSVSQESYNLLKCISIPFPQELKSQLEQIKKLSFKDYLVVENSYSHFIARELSDAFTEEYDFISIHGHTTYHLPEQSITHQMINGGIVSALTQKKVITDFRIGDITMGGVGTPLVPMVEQQLFGSYDYFLNLGGIANLTQATDWTAYDVSPCNQLSNYVARDTVDGYDKDSLIAMTGKFDSVLYDALDDFEYYSSSGPKSLDNSWIRENYFPILDNESISQADKLCTINKWIADKILKNLAPAKTLYITGGGAYNKQLIEFLKQNDKQVAVHIPDDELIEYKEAILMAYLGYLRLHDLTNILCSVTGASSDTVGGAIYNVHGR